MPVVSRDFSEYLYICHCHKMKKNVGITHIVTIMICIDKTMHAVNELKFMKRKYFHQSANKQ